MNLLLVFALFISLASSTPVGAPIEACDTLEPQHGVVAQTTPSPYAFVPVNNGDGTYQTLVHCSWNCPGGWDIGYFDPAPYSQDVREGDDLLMRCDVSKRQLIVFFWTLNGKQLANTSRRFQESGNLRIRRVNRDLDSGGFRCIATNVCNGLALRSAEVRLNILWLSDQVVVERVEPERNGTTSETKDVTLKCQVDAKPEPTFEWFRNSIKLFANDHFQMTKNRVKILGVTTSDNGVYSCRARNAAGQADSLENFVLNEAD